MPMTEKELKAQLKAGTLSPLYFVYGDEPYLVAHYAARIAAAAVPEDDMAAFNRHVLDGTSLSADALEAATQALPLMGERTCVWVKDYDAGAANASLTDRVKAILTAVGEPCVLLFSVTAFSPDMKKNAKWKAFLKEVDKRGVSVSFERRSASETAAMLSKGAAKRGCVLSTATASKMVEQVGGDLFLLLNELDKLCAVVGEGGEITADVVQTAAVKALDASVYELSKALLRRRYDAAYACIAKLFASNEEPIRMLAVLSETYVDLYRAKVAAVGGIQATALADTFSYRGREFRLRNAAGDCRALSLEAIRESLELLSTADTRMKSSAGKTHRLILEETVARLILIAKGATA
ncbi:MAG: DNA polymerase III subunit delta [Clostridia bacterium]|nr:DNA polymerase III subunit delta [Clostridia bacterium]